MHGRPRLGEKPILILIRDPMATLFSLYKVLRARWGQTEGLWPWLPNALAEYVAFYTDAFDLLESSPGRVLLVRYEDLVRDAGALERVVRFVGHRPKLRPEFVHHVMRFENFARSGDRTFYRSGRNDAWIEDPEFCEAVRRLPDEDFGRWGYPSMSAFRAMAGRESLGAGRE
jgi:hypothetical protein